MRLFILSLSLLFSNSGQVLADDRPNIFLFFADDWGKYAGIYADPEEPSLNDLLETPNIDRVGREGVVFENAFVNVASCGPCRASLATGRYFWSCGSGAFLNGKASDWRGVENPMQTLPKFGDLLRESGYYAQKSRKTFSFTSSKPTADWKKYGAIPYERYGLYVGTAKDESERHARHEEIIENSRREMERVLSGTPDDQPFFFVFGSINIHRPYTPNSGAELWGIDPDSLEGLIPPYLPDEHDVRRDFSDYLGEVEALDLMLGAMLGELEKVGELDNTIVILSGDHGIPGVPRGKTNCYDLATRVPMLVRWPEKIPGGRHVNDFVSVMDVGPTLLELAGVETDVPFDGQSFYQQLQSSKEGWIDPERDSVIIGRELHVHTSRPGRLPYPSRAIRSKDFLYIRNLKPDRWPQGNPFEAAETNNSEELYELGLSTYPTYQDLDGSLTKAYLLGHRSSSQVGDSINLTLGKRPEEELYDMRNDPFQMKNLAETKEFSATLQAMREEIGQIMKESKDPRLSDAFDGPPWIKPEETP